jgi:large subunit ribosomal protein L22
MEIEVKAKLNYLRIAPRKVRLVADLVRGKSVKTADNLLEFSLKKAALPLKKLLKSAVANAENNFELEKESLRILKITVDEGPKLKRWRARARGRAAKIEKKTSHISIWLSGEKKKIKKAVGEEIPEPKEKIKPERKEDSAKKEDSTESARAKAKKLETKKRKPIKLPEAKALKRIFKRKSF